MKGEKEQTSICDILPQYISHGIFEITPTPIDMDGKVKFSIDEIRLHTLLLNQYVLSNAQQQI